MKKILYYTYRQDNQGSSRDYVVITYTDYSVKVLHRGDRGFAAAAAKARSSKRPIRGVRSSR